jgi:hypothetical protein
MIKKVIYNSGLRSKGIHSKTVYYFLGIPFFISLEKI